MRARDMLSVRTDDSQQVITRVHAVRASRFRFRVLIHARIDINTGARHESGRPARNGCLTLSPIFGVNSGQVHIHPLFGDGRLSAQFNGQGFCLVRVPALDQRAHNQTPEQCRMCALAPLAFENAQCAACSTQRVRTADSLRPDNGISNTAGFCFVLIENRNRGICVHCQFLIDWLRVLIASY
nr:MAG TPA: hypothetical protein [Caudoviricetes sp.]DAH95937.1 MAG TPA: hypothetical protein [Caudoviricetes sp.]